SARGCNTGTKQCWSTMRAVPPGDEPVRIGVTRSRSPPTLSTWPPSSTHGRAGWSNMRPAGRSMRVSPLHPEGSHSKPAAAHGCNHHKDGGSQHAPEVYRSLLADHWLVGSMGGRGNPFDNAKAESFMKALGTLPRSNKKQREGAGRNFSGTR